jgi:subtilisin-like proprotein convertase family protein
LETLEDRRLLATVNDPFIDTTPQAVVDDGGSDGDADGVRANHAAGVQDGPTANLHPSVISANERALERSFEAASDLQRYTDEEFNSANIWVIKTNDTITEGELEEYLTTDLLPTDLIDNTYLYDVSEVKLTPKGSPLSIIGSLEANDGIEFYYPEVGLEGALKFTPNDTLFPFQWHLENTGQTGGVVGEDVNITTAWDRVTGNGVVVGVIDDAVQHTHPDLAPNYRADLSFDYWDNDSDPAPVNLFNESHGTTVAGVAVAAGDNAIGVAGSGFNAGLAGLRAIVGAAVDSTASGALVHENQAIHVYNNSWGAPDDGDIYPITPLTLAAVQQGVASGRGGLGSVFTWAAGNGLGILDNANLDGYANARYSIAVGAIGHDGVQADYSEPGASILVTAHSMGTTPDGILTTDLLGTDGINFAADGSDGDLLIDIDYTSQFSGTSSSTPLVSGIVALMLEENPSLSYRDVQHILVETARQNDAGDADWATNGAGRLVNHKYGFGAVDALAAVNASTNWVTVPQEVATASGVVTVGQAIPDNSPTGITMTFDITDDITTEWIEVSLNATHTYATDLEVILTSPSGTQSILNNAHILPFGVPGPFNGHTLTSARSWGESSIGTWTMEVRDLQMADSGTWDSFEVTVFGTGDVVDPPVDPTDPVDPIDPDDPNRPVDPNAPTGLQGISGVVFSDNNGDGLRDLDEPYVAQAWVFIDVDGDGNIGLGEPGAIADDYGRYHIPVSPAGEQIVRVIVEPGWTVSSPASGSYLIDMTVNPNVDNINFGLLPAFDYGDAPAPYATLIADDGPVHGILGDFHLGTSIADGGVGIDAEADGYQGTASTDDNAGVDDEDGVTAITPLSPGSTGTIEVVVSTGNNAAGFLNAWIDFNGDGVFASSEQITTDLLLGAGTHTIDVAVPGSAINGVTYGRFRYSGQSGLGPTGAALSGEVEDHPMFILGSHAVAGDDAFTVAIDSVDNPLDVLVNDVPSVFAAADSLILLPPSLETTAEGGLVSVDNNGTFSDTSDDQLRYTPPFGFIGEDTFTYRVLDTSGSFDTATVTITVALANGPTVLDNTFRVPADSVSNILDVLSNDLPGIDGPIAISSFNGVTSGLLTIGNGGASLLYTPNVGFNGTDQFEYTVRDSQGNTGTGQVTLLVGDTTADDELNIAFTVTDLSGNPITGSLIVGQTVLLNATIQDPRATIPPLDRGVFSAYFDVLYDSNMVSVAGDATFNSAYPAAQIFRPAINGLLDEGGAFQDNSTASPLGPNPQILFSVPFTAEQVGLVTFSSDPADVLPEHEAALNRPTVANTALSVEQIDFGSITLGILPQPDLVDVTVEVTDSFGNPLTGVAVGDSFNVRVYAEDLREPFALDHGAFSFYADLLFDDNLVMVGSDNTLPGNISFNARFSEGQNAQLSAGVIDEAGAILDGGSPVGSDPVLIYEVTFTAIAAGVVNFRSDPADNLPLRETTLQSSGEVVPSTRMTFGNDLLAIGDGPQRNAKNALDVNADHTVTTLDVLQLVNAINNSVAGRATNVVDKFLDVNGDDELSAIDALILINYINANGFFTGPSKSIAASAAALADQSNARLADAQGELIVQAEPVALPPADNSAPLKKSDSPVFDVPSDDVEISDDLAADILVNWTK